ncbi:ECs_2282 family putative zinc-binding protein [Ewingella americana]|uniref:ECs_2282 family putative zinc-binding protein n=1 Tax=Ewingella americana TaxID=41202 RepID=UPI003D677C9F
MTWSYAAVSKSKVQDIEGTTCNHCNRTIHKNDLVKQASGHAEKLVRDMIGKHFK